MVPGAAAYSYKLSLTTAAQNMVAANTYFTQYVYMPFASALMGVSYNNPGSALTLSLLDTTANKTIYSVSVAANSVGQMGMFTTTQYPLVAGNQLVWQAAGAGISTCQVNPYYLAPAGGPNTALGIFADFTTPQGTTFSTSTPIYAQTAQSSTTTSTYARTFSLLRAGACYGMRGQFLQSSNTGTCSVQATLYDITAGAALCNGTVTNTGGSTNISFAASPVAIPANHNIGLQLLGVAGTTSTIVGAVYFDIACII